MVNTKKLLIPVVTACDQAFLPGLRALLCSINRHSPERKIYVLDCGIAEIDKEELLRLYSSLEFRIAPHIPGLPMPTTVGSYAAYARLLIGKIFVDQDRVIYLDADTVIISDLPELDVLTLAPNEIIAACIEPYTPTFDSHNGVLDHQKLGLDGSIPYFNDGVMLIDVQKWNKSRVMDRATNYLKRSDIRITHFDQEALNVVLVGYWKTLDPKWNVSRYWVHAERRTIQPKILEEARIVHFLSPEKPWLDPTGVDSWLLKKFQEYSDYIQEQASESNLFTNG